MILGFRFAKGTGWSSRMIEWFGGGKYSHVDAILPDGRLLGARSDKIPAGTPAGVEIRPSDYLKGQDFFILHLEVDDDKGKAYFQFLMDQLHKPYNKIGIVGFVIGRNWREEDSWFCSELITAALEDAEIIPHLAFTPAKIIPNSLALVLSALGAH